MRRFEIYPGKDGQWYIRYVAQNGEPWYISTEGYTRYADAKRSVQDFCKEIQAGGFEIRRI